MCGKASFSGSVSGKGIQVCGLGGLDGEAAMVLGVNATATWSRVWIVL